jgi:hypothetical protein
MTHTLTEKENYKMLMSGQQPEWVPFSSLGPRPDGKPAPVGTVFPGLLDSSITAPGKVTDVLGVTYVPVPEAANAKLPEPNNFILKDIRKWRDVIKAPDISGIDWEAMAKKDFEFFNVNPKDSLVSLGSHFGYFMYLMAFMGFSEGLCAMYEEPEEVKALMEYLCDFFVKVIRSSIDYYKPDIFDMCDDIAAEKNPFISPEMYRELIKPFAARQAEIALDRGIPISMHCCGHCDEFIDDWRDFGVLLWNPAQPVNDLQAVKKKYGNSLIICGGWDPRKDFARPDVTEEEVKDSVYKTIDKLAPGGGYVFSGGFLGPIGDEAAKEKNRWVMDAASTYCKSFYQK